MDMSEADHADYVGTDVRWKGRRALVLPDDTYHLPLEQRTLSASFDSGLTWDTFPVTDFHLVMAVKC